MIATYIGCLAILTQILHFVNLLVNQAVVLVSGVILTILLCLSIRCMYVYFKEKNWVLSELQTYSNKDEDRTNQLRQIIDRLTFEDQKDMQAVGTAIYDIEQMNRQFTRQTAEKHQCDKQIAALHNFTPLKLPTEELPKYALAEEIQILAKILGDTKCDRSNVIDLIRKAGSHSVRVLYNKTTGKPLYIPLRLVMNDVAKSVGVYNPSNIEELELETCIVEKAFNQALEKMPMAERTKLEAEIKKAAAEGSKNYSGVASSSLAMAAAQASGFGVYMMASTLVGGITHAIGVSLPFAFYTSMSSVLSVVIGPAGWLALTAWTIHKIASPNHKQTIPAIIMLVAIRNRAEQDRVLELSHKIGTSKNLEDSLARFKRERINTMAQLDRLKVQCEQGKMKRSKQRQELMNKSENEREESRKRLEALLPNIKYNSNRSLLQNSL